VSPRPARSNVRSLRARPPTAQTGPLERVADPLRDPAPLVGGEDLLDLPERLHHLLPRGLDLRLELRQEATPPPPARLLQPPAARAPPCPAGRAAPGAGSRGRGPAARPRRIRRPPRPARQDHRGHPDRPHPARRGARPPPPTPPIHPSPRPAPRTAGCSAPAG